MYDLDFYSRKGGIFETFFAQRSKLIVDYRDGVIDKKEFLHYNYDLVMKTNLKPFLRIDTYEMGMYNYQYYNVLAKYYTTMAKEIKNTRKHQKYYNYYLNKGNNYYTEKDKAALALLEFLDYKGIEAYYVEVNSKSLRDKLYEIVLLNYEEAIFHSKSQGLLDKLKENDVFIDEQRKSLIDAYINQTY